MSVFLYKVDMITSNFKRWILMSVSQLLKVHSFPFKWFAKSKNNWTKDLKFLDETTMHHRNHTDEQTDSNIFLQVC